MTAAQLERFQEHCQRLRLFKSRDRLEALLLDASTREWSSRIPNGWQRRARVRTGPLKSICHRLLDTGCSNRTQGWRPPGPSGAISPWRCRIAVTVLYAGTGARPSVCNRRRSLRAPHAGCCCRRATSATSRSAGVRLGDWRGRRARSDRPAGPSRRDRPGHLYPVLRLTP